MDVVTLWKHKGPSGWGRWEAYDVGTDEFGTWLFTPARSTFRSEDRQGAAGRCDVARDADGLGRDSLVLLPVGRWFVAHWVLDAECVVNVDISTPPARAGSEWAFEDLELDPFVRPDGTFGVDDEDEFTEACRAGLITGVERDASLRTVQDLRAELTVARSRLLETGLRRLDQAARLGLAPLS